MNVGIAYTEPDVQFWVRIDVPQGSTLQDAIERSGLLERFPRIDLHTQKVGIFGKITPLHALVKEGDRVEVYRPITADPPGRAASRSPPHPGNSARRARRPRCQHPRPSPPPSVDRNPKTPPAPLDRRSVPRQSSGQPAPRRSRVFVPLQILHPDVVAANARHAPVDLHQWRPGIVSLPVFSLAYCAHLIRKAERRGEYEPVEDDWERSHAGARGKEIGVGRLQEGERIFAAYVRHVLPAIRAYYHVEIAEILEPFVIKYSLDGVTSMARHKDRDGKVSGVLRLNDGYTGCRLRFPDRGFDAGDTPVGHMVLFPHYFDHEVTELESGERYSLAFWSR